MLEMNPEDVKGNAVGVSVNDYLASSKADIQAAQLVIACDVDDA